MKKFISDSLKILWAATLVFWIGFIGFVGAYSAAKSLDVVLLVGYEETGAKQSGGER